MDVFGDQGDHCGPAGEEKEDVPASEESGRKESTDERGPEASTPSSEGVYTGVHCVGRDCSGHAEIQ